MGLTDELRALSDARLEEAMIQAAADIANNDGRQTAGSSADLDYAMERHEKALAVYVERKLASKTEEEAVGVPEVEWDTQRYVEVDADEREGDSLAAELFERGLIYLLNEAVLHRHGYAIGVTVEPADHTVSGLTLHKTNDPDGIWFSEDLTVHGRRKLRAAGLR